MNKLKFNLFQLNLYQHMKYELKMVVIHECFEA